MTCRYDDCEGEVVALGRCKRHYDRDWRANLDRDSAYYRRLKPGRQQRMRATEREHRSLTTIPEPKRKSRSVLELRSAGTILIQGEGPPISYDCGVCASPLLVDVRPDQVTNVVLVCANCGAYNEGPSR